MAKQPSFSDHSTTVSKCDYDRLNIDALLEPLFTVSGLIDASFDGLVESRSTDSDQNDFIERAIHLGSVILDAGKRSARKQSTVHNISIWPLPPELTIKVFSMLDRRSACSAAATCWLFQKCAADPQCYTNIDLATIRQKLNVPKLNDAVVSTLIERAGQALESIKLVSPHSYISYDDDSYYGERNESPILTGSCLRSLSANGGAPGSRLRRLHLHSINIYKNMWDDPTLTAALSASLSSCPSLVEIKIVQMHVRISPILESVSRCCRLLEGFIFECSEGRCYPLEASVCKEFVLNCPKITTLALQLCQVYDSEAFELVKGFHELKYLDFTDVHHITGSFLKNLGTEGGANSLEVLILRQCHDLEKVAVEKFMEALFEGKFRHLRHLDISSVGGLREPGHGIKLYNVSRISAKRLLERRPNFCLVNEDWW